jgi:lactoylglutathione lyase
MIKVNRTGHILYVKKYKECVTFYKNMLQLNILFQIKELTCFDFYGTYLMVELEDREEYLNTISTQKTFNCIRINVSNVKDAANELISKNIKVDYREYDWGKIAKFFDPDGNLLEFKDEESFAKQIEDYKSH